jgi:hypothetical protein
MSIKRIALAIAFAVAVSFCLVPMTSHASVATLDSCAHHADSAAASLNPGAQCIPCSPSRPCQNPLTICSYKGGSLHGCCLGYAGRS